MPGIHKNPTISFRANKWERDLIEERVALSGINKKDFIARSCIYSNIVVVGKKENVQKIVNAMENLIDVFNEIVRQLQSGDVSFSEDVYNNMRNDALATALTIVEILNGAAYLFDKEPQPFTKDYKKLLDPENDE
ncbi:plasmid mobilization protein [Anaerosporobacter sp.]|uniref:plasmid mobilization protein n=1 Tax=Anaerosporobacter sp. TaxID=1872529 RepID=UPI00286EFC4D|nr:hypothetical protein [Anaerosporobacter sp.]